ncbi:tRNA (adenosine(37)-N6)-threonylcarbamoyltransferase complex dimerization subunit type 1 TsaB [Peptoniphilaceae bacterium SGI.131]
MKVLAIDTSTMISSVAILEDGQIIGDYSVNQVRTHSEMLMVMVRDLLDNLGLKLEDIDLFAVSKGPGSFTGLRIGVTIAKTLAQVFNKPIIGISSLEALANSVYFDGLIVPVIDARAKRIFSGIYKREGKKLVLLEEETLTDIDSLGEYLRGQKAIILGDGAYKFREKLEDEQIFAGGHLDNCIARAMCILAKEKYEAGFRDSYFDLSPNYLRKSQAELDFERKA